MCAKSLIWIGCEVFFVVLFSLGMVGAGYAMPADVLDSRSIQKNYQEIYNGLSSDLPGHLKDQRASQSLEVPPAVPIGGNGSSEAHPWSDDPFQRFVIELMHKD